ncbi:MAG TPA: MFS transporter [Stellaceae bacterium]|nr:MFS transporter [Stellaceae bacterium]
MASTEVIQGRALFQNRWWIVAASLVGMIVGPGTAVIFTVNVFMVPVTTELHWSRGLFSSGLLASAALSPVMTPLFGYLMDRYGIHKIALPTTFVYGLALCSFSLMSANAFWPVYLMFACASGFGACLGPVVYSKAITAWFDKERGLALGIATSGVGLGTFLVPLLAQFFISEFGWRAAYVAVGVTTWLLSFSMVAIFVREPPGYFERMRAARAAATKNGPQPFGLSTLAAITGTRQFWLLALIFLLEGVANNGILSGHFVPMLLDRGYTAPAAAALLGTSGLAALAARIVVGLCLDWVRGPIFSACVMLLPVLGVALLLSHVGVPAPFFAAICFGLAIGAEVDMLGFFASRYFGRRSFGTLYGLIFAMFALGIGVGPAILGAGFDRFHSYDQVLWVFLALLVLAAALFLLLGKYNYPKGTT